MTPWDVLRIEPTGDEREIKRAYARLLKSTRPEDDPAAFQLLRDAYEYALNQARYAATVTTVPDGLDEADAPIAPGLLAAPDTPDAPDLLAAPDAPHAPDLAEVQEARDAPGTYEDPAFGPFAIARLQPAIEAPELARPDPEHEAWRLWEGFERIAAVAPRHGLAQLAASDDMLDLQVREHFELCAVRYCAGAACPDTAREAIAEFFEWQTDAALIAREALDETREMLARLRAQHSFAFFQQQALRDPAVQAILSNDAGRNFGRTIDATFTRNMQDLIMAIRFHHPEMLHFKLNPDVFAAWERRVTGRRFFLHTAGYTFVAGVALWIGALIALIDFDILNNYGIASFLGAQALAFALIGWLTEYPPAALRVAAAAWRDRAGVLLHDVRHWPAWQFGWIGLYIVAAACLFIPSPPLLVEMTVTAALLAALAGALFANSAALNRRAYVVAGVFGIALGVTWASQVSGGRSLLAWIAAVMCGMLLLYRGGADLCQWLGVPERRLPLVRSVWLAGAAGLLAVTHLFALPLAACVLATFLWLKAGMLLSAPRINPFLAIFGALIFYGLVLDAAVVLPSPMPGLSIAVIAVAIFMVVNMARANKNQHHFS